MNNFFTFALNSIFRRKSKNIFIYVVFSLVIAINLSFFSVSETLKKELILTLDSLPEIIVQKIIAGRQRDINIKRADEILNINAVSNVYNRLWGYYYFDFAGANFSVIGIDEFEEPYKKSLNKIANIYYDNLSNNSIIIGQSVYNIFKNSGYDNNVYLKKYDGSYIKLKIAGVFNDWTNLESSDTIVMSKDLFRNIFNVPETLTTDIAVKVENPLEISNVKSKIAKLYSDIRIITKDDVKLSYQNIFDYKSSIFIIIISVCFITFLIIIYDKLSGIDAEEKQEIALLKSLGWSINNIITVKFYESIIVAILSFLTGFLLSLIYVYYMDAPIIKEIFSGYSILKPDFHLSYYFNLKLYFSVFLLTVPLFIIAGIIPAWKASILDADEALND